MQYIEEKPMYILFAIASEMHMPWGNINIDGKANMSSKYITRVHSTSLVRLSS